MKIEVAPLRNPRQPFVLGGVYRLINAQFGDDDVLRILAHDCRRRYWMTSLHTGNIAAGPVNSETEMIALIDELRYIYCPEYKIVAGE